MKIIIGFELSSTTFNQAISFFKRVSSSVWHFLRSLFNKHTFRISSGWQSKPPSKQTNGAFCVFPSCSFISPPDSEVPLTRSESLCIHEHTIICPPHQELASHHSNFTKATLLKFYLDRTCF